MHGPVCVPVCVDMFPHEIIHRCKLDIVFYLFPHFFEAGLLLDLGLTERLSRKPPSNPPGYTYPQPLVSSTGTKNVCLCAWLWHIVENPKTGSQSWPLSTPTSDPSPSYLLRSWLSPWALWEPPLHGDGCKDSVGLSSFCSIGHCKYCGGLMVAPSLLIVLPKRHNHVGKFTYRDMVTGLKCPL